MSKDQGRGGTNSGLKVTNHMENVVRSISSHGISAQDIIEIMQQAVAKCPKISTSGKGVHILSLLDLGCEVSLIQYSYFKEHLLSKIEDPTGEKSDAHIIFNLTAANDGQLPMKKYIDFDVNFLGTESAGCSVSYTRRTKLSLDKKHQNKLPGI